MGITDYEDTEACTVARQDQCRPQAWIPVWPGSPPLCDFGGPGRGRNQVSEEQKQWGQFLSGPVPAAQPLPQSGAVSRTCTELGLSL